MREMVMENIQPKALLDVFTIREERGTVNN